MLGVPVLCPGRPCLAQFTLAKFVIYPVDFSSQEKLGTVNQGRTFAVYNYEAENDDEVN